MLIVFFGLWAAPASILGGWGRVLEIPRPYFSNFLHGFACSGARMARLLRPLQNTGRSDTKHTSEHVAHRARDAKNKQKSAQQLPGQRFLLRAHDYEVLARSWTDFCQVWTSPGRLLGGSWALLGRSRALLATSWAHLGHIFGALGPLLAANCSPRWARARFFIDLGWILAPFGAPFGGVAPGFWEEL